mgnify:CR=1 FL=1
MNLDIISAIDARRLVEGKEERAQQDMRDMLARISDAIRADATDGKRSTEVSFEVSAGTIHKIVVEFTAAGFTVDQSPFWYRQDGMQAQSKGIAPRGYRLKISW